MASHKKDREQWRETTRHALPPISFAYRRSTRLFLQNILKRQSANLAQHRQLLRDRPDDRTRGMVQYLNHYCSTLRDLLALNESRRGYGKLS